MSNVTGNLSAQGNVPCEGAFRIPAFGGGGDLHRGEGPARGTDHTAYAL